MHSSLGNVQDKLELALIQILAIIYFFQLKLTKVKMKLTVADTFDGTDLPSDSFHSSVFSSLGALSASITELRALVLASEEEKD